MTAPDEAFVFNVVWTGSVFPYLRLFVASLMDRSGARFRFVTNACPPDQIELMERFAEAHPGRVVEVFVASPEQMINHGVALDAVRERRDDGEFFAFVDPDIKANAPWVGDLAGLLVDGCAAVTSGKEVWSESNVIPDGHPGVNGEYFFAPNGFVFGSPHLAVYRRDALEATCERWGIGFGSGGNELTDEGRAALTERGADYWIYDTAKLVNAFLQVDGHGLVHRDLPQLVHIGGLAHFLAPREFRRRDGEGVEPDWHRFPWNPSRFDAARYTAEVLLALCAGEPAPPVPAVGNEGLAARLEGVAGEVADLVARYGSW